MGKTKIEWATDSWNPVRARNLKTGKVGWHCEHATTGCEFCYSEGFNKRLGTGLPYKPGHRKDIEIFLDEQMLTQPLRWKKPRKIFVCSMTDAFADFVTDEMLHKMFAAMALCPQHTFQVLTKRAERMREYLEMMERCFHGDGDGYAKRWGQAAADVSGSPCAAGAIEDVDFPIPNVWLGVSAERQQEANERIPDLLATPAAVRFVSIEPMLGPIDLVSPLYRGEGGATMRGYLRDHAEPDDFHHHARKLDWVIVGGESGRQARSMHPDWARSLRDQCAASRTAFFFKQWGEWVPSTPEDASTNPHSGWQANAAHPHVAEASELYPEAGAKFVARVGKAAAGRLLDGVEHNAFPKVPA